MMELFNDEDNFLHSDPKEKFFDIVFNANNDVVRFELEQLLQQFVAMESILEETLSENELDRKINEKIFSDGEEIKGRLTNLFMVKMGDILSKSE
jgi:hypothetical protein